MTPVPSLICLERMSDLDDVYEHDLLNAAILGSETVEVQ
jgi:hypothetical protein